MSPALLASGEAVLGQPAHTHATHSHEATIEVSRMRASLLEEVTSALDAESDHLVKETSASISRMERR